MTSENWQSLSEIVAGKVIQGKVALNKVRPEIFVEPYDRIIELMGKGVKSKEEICAEVGANVVQAALDAAKSFANYAEHNVNWEVVLEQVAMKNLVAGKLLNVVRRLEHGEDVNTTEVLDYFRNLDSQKPYIISMDQIQADDMPFIESGWAAIDKELGGLPKAGLVTVGASPKVGKTTFMICLASRFKRRYPDKKIVIFTLEMIRSEFKQRMLDLFPDLREDIETQKRILVEDAGGLSVQEVANKAARETDVGLVCVDFADLMIQDENNESEMAKIYRVLANLAKSMQIPVILLGQFSKEYHGGVPLPRYLRYTSLAEALSWMVLMLYDPARDFQRTKDTMITLPNTPGYAYIVAWAIRGGFIKHPNDSPGAIKIYFTGKKGWGEFSESWQRLAIE